jgi:hypothetical protein
MVKKQLTLVGKWNTALTVEKHTFEEMASCPVFHLDDPNVGIKINLSLEILRRFSLGKPGSTATGRPAAFGVHFLKPGRRRAVERDAAIKEIDLDIDGAAVALTAAYDNSRSAVDHATPNIGFDPDL